LFRHSLEDLAACRLLLAQTILQLSSIADAAACSEPCDPSKNRSAAAEAAALGTRFGFRLEAELGRHLQLTGPVEIAAGGALLVECGGAGSRIRAKAAL
jgi:hypothetical protein